MLGIRPKVAELVFQLYGRPLHPELFEICRARRVECGDYSAKIEITSAGHVITWRYAGLTLTEVAGSTQPPLSKRRRLMFYSVKGPRQDRVDCRGGACYQVNFELERVDPEVFWIIQQELTLDGLTQGMLHRFDSGGRFGQGALSYINVETRRRQMSVQAFHTFPDDCAVLKSQSLFQLP
ncbi:MAG: DUF2617 family protein [Pirellulales bacterium]|nr:DUF2617 family protein [Pirellulales bacterium]